MKTPQTRREFLQKATLGSATLAAVTRLSAQSSEASRPSVSERPRRPNLLFLWTDQHRGDAVPWAGDRVLQAPNLQALGERSFCFQRTYCTQPVCTPSRGSIMTGLLPHNHGSYTNNIRLDPAVRTIAEYLPDDTRTAYFGKWHLLGGNRDRPIPKELSYGFDTVLTNNCHTDFRAGKAFFWNKNGEKEFFNEWEPYGQTRQAIDYLKDIDKNISAALTVA